VDEEAESWWVLRVTFPERIASHTRVQASYFGDDGLLRRHRDTVDILGGAQDVNYALDYRDVGGIKVPMKRQVFAYDERKRRCLSPYSWRSTSTKLLSREAR
jgi:hypothetical protein